MKIVIDIDLVDLLKEVEDEESGNTYYEIKNKEEFKEDIRATISDQITDNIRYNFSFEITQEIKKLVGENKNEIIDKVVKEVSKKIIESKAIHDFRKQLKEMENSLAEKVKSE